jgi:hypothetical protein
MMSTQVALRSFPEAMMYVRRQVAEQRHASQVQQIQRGAHQGPAPMDVSALLAAIANLRGENTEPPPEDASDLDTIIAALKGKGKGKSKGKAEDRECYNCGKVGHLARDCLASSTRQPGYQPKGDGNGKGKGKGDAKGKNWALNNLAEGETATDAQAISLGCLVRAPAEAPLKSMAVEKSETWDGYECVDALMDSGAGECVCGPQHFGGVRTRADANRASAGVEYVCADGGRIPNLGEKAINGLSEEGQKLAINFQVTSVDRPLIAVSKLTAAGHNVWFGRDHGVITHGVTGKHTTFLKTNGVYVLKVWVPLPAAAVSGGTRQ